MANKKDNVKKERKVIIEYGDKKLVDCMKDVIIGRLQSDNEEGVLWEEKRK